jgi:hypothetical protein
MFFVLLATICITPIVTRAYGDIPFSGDVAIHRNRYMSPDPSIGTSPIRPFKGMVADLKASSLNLRERDRFLLHI